jgi:hypothetical protein
VSDEDVGKLVPTIRDRMQRHLRGLGKLPAEPGWAPFDADGLAALKAGIEVPIDVHPR